MFLYTCSLVLIHKLYKTLSRATKYHNLQYLKLYLNNCMIGQFVPHWAHSRLRHQAIPHTGVLLFPLCPNLSVAGLPPARLSTDRPVASVWVLSRSSWLIAIATHLITDGLAPIPNSPWGPDGDEHPFLDKDILTSILEVQG